MSQILDREFQLAVLRKLSEVYPEMPNMRRVFGAEWDERYPEFVRNIRYLDEHRLVTAKWSQPISGGLGLLFAQITAEGLDFLADDGGLTAIRGVITVKLHDDTIRQLLIRRIEAAEGDRSVKDALVTKVRQLPADALGAVTTRGLDAALSRVPDLLSLLQSLLT